VSGPEPTSAVLQPASITLSPRRDTLSVGNSLQLTALIRDQFGNPMSVTPTWSSTYPQTASISATGLVTARAEGVTLIRAQVSNSWSTLVGKSDIWVEEASGPSPDPIARVVVSPSSLSLTAIGSTALLTAAAQDGSGNQVGGATFTWRSTNDSVATVSNGTVTARRIGSALIVAAATCCGGPADTASVQVAGATNNPPQTPSVSVGSITSTGATLNGGPFTDPDAGNTHAATQWQVDVASGSFASPVYDSGESTTSLTSRSVTGLTASTGYRARVRYRDNQGAWSGWSATPTFTTSAAAGGGGGGGSYLFASDWSTATGTSQAAITDGGRWDRVTPNFTGRIVPSTGLDFPTANVFDVWSNGTRDAWLQLIETSMPPLAVGQSRYFRFYIRVAMPDNLEDSGTHGIEDMSPGGTYAPNWDFDVTNAGGSGVPAGRFRGRLDTRSTRWAGPVLNKNQTYRYEFQIHRNTATTFLLHARVYDSAGTLLADDAGFRDSFNSSRTLASGVPNPIVMADGFQGITAGNNGLAGSPPYPFTIFYQGAFCIRSDTWCGPYTPGEGR
jgi:hypothetical protein